MLRNKGCYIDYFRARSWAIGTQSRNSEESFAVNGLGSVRSRHLTRQLLDHVVVKVNGSFKTFERSLRRGWSDWPSFAIREIAIGADAGAIAVGYELSLDESAQR